MLRLKNKFFGLGPPPPTDVEISYVGSSSIDVIWDHATSGVIEQTTDYEVTYTSSDETITSKQTNTAAVNHLTISGLSPNSFYSINVVALTDTDNIFSDESPSVSTTTGKLACCSINVINLMT